MPGSSLSGFSPTRQTPPYTQILGCEGGRATRMAPDATTEKIRDKNKKNRFNSSRQAVTSIPFMSKEAPGGGKSSRKQKINKEQNKLRVTVGAHVCVVCLLSSHLLWTSRLWTYQPGSHRRKVTKDFSTFLLRCLPSFLSREGFIRSFPLSTVNFKSH